MELLTNTLESAAGQLGAAVLERAQSELSKIIGPGFEKLPAATRDLAAQCMERKLYASFPGVTVSEDERQQIAAQLATLESMAATLTARTIDRVLSLALTAVLNAYLPLPPRPAA